MARPQRNNVDYFPLYCDEGKKMYYLEETYGNDGFATFIKLLRELAKTNYHYLDLSKNTTMMFLAAKCKISKDTLESIINDLVELEKFDPTLWNENRVVWCQDFIDSIQDAYSKRNNNCITYEGLLDLLIGLGVRKQSKSKSKGVINPQSKVKKSKVNNIEQKDFESEDYKKEMVKYFNNKSEEEKLDNIKVLKEAKEAYDYYQELNWCNSNGKIILNLKSTIWNNWIKKDLEKFRKEVSDGFPY